MLDSVGEGDPLSIFENSSTPSSSSSWRFMLSGASLEARIDRARHVDLMSLAVSIDRQRPRPTTGPARLSEAPVNSPCALPSLAVLDQMV